MPDIHMPTPELLATAQFRKSRRSDNQSSCVEVADNLLASTGHVYVRDSKHKAGAVLSFTRAEWEAFTGGVRDGEFDLR